MPSRGRGASRPQPAAASASRSRPSSYACKGPTGDWRGADAGSIEEGDGAGTGPDVGACAHVTRATCPRPVSAFRWLRVVLVWRGVEAGRAAQRRARALAVIWMRGADRAADASRVSVSPVPSFAGGRGWARAAPDELKRAPSRTRRPGRCPANETAELYGLLLSAPPRMLILYGRLFNWLYTKERRRLYE